MWDMPIRLMATQNQEVAMTDLSTVEKDGARFEGIKLLPCENPLPLVEKAIEAAENAFPTVNYYTEPYSGPRLTLVIKEGSETNLLAKG